MFVVKCAMIISYLARIILLLPEITAAEANKLAEIADQSIAQIPSTKQPKISPDVFSPMHDFNRPLKKAKLSLNNQKIMPQITDMPKNCVPVNETMRKHLIKVSIFFSRENAKTFKKCSVRLFNFHGLIFVNSFVIKFRNFLMRQHMTKTLCHHQIPLTLLLN